MLRKLLVGLIFVVGCDDGSSTTSAANDPLAEYEYEHPVRPLPDPLLVTYDNRLSLSDPQETLTFSLTALDGGEITEIDPERRWHLTPLSRYEATVSAPPYYAPTTGSFRTGRARDVIVADTVLRQGLRLGQDAVAARNYARNEIIVGRASVEPDANFEYIVVQYDPGAPLELSTTPILYTQAPPRPPVISPDGRTALLHTDQGVRVWDFERGEALTGVDIGELDLSSVAWARSGVGVAAGHRSGSRFPVAFGWATGQVELLLEGTNPPSGPIGGFERRLSLSGDGTLLAQIEAGYPALYPLGSGAMQPIMATATSPRDGLIFLGATGDTVYELATSTMGPCQASVDCELWVNGTMLQFGIWGFAASREVPSAIVAKREPGNGTGTLQLFQHDPSLVSIMNRPEAGGLIDLATDGIEPLDFNTHRVPELTLPGQGIIFRDGLKTLAYSASTGEGLVINGSWTPFVRPDGVVLLREAFASFGTVTDTCPESGTCQLQLLNPALDTIDESLQFKAGLPFGENRDRYLEWGCETGDSQCDELRILEVSSSKLRIAAGAGAPRLGESDGEAAVLHLDAPCVFSGGYCVR